MVPILAAIFTVALAASVIVYAAVLIGDRDPLDEDFTGGRE